jgi:hypothetical protein
LAIVVATAGLAACEASLDLPTEPRGVAALVEGTWAEPVSFPGISFVMQLSARDTVLSGTGTYSIEAGRSGTLSEAGFVAGQMVQLTITYDYGPVAYFQGTLTDRNTLSGAIKYGPPESEIPSVAVRFERRQ